LFGETDDSALRRAACAQSAGLQVIFCVGETLAEREAGATLAVVERQIRGLGASTGHLVVAYEPVWAIGTGRNATTEQAEEAHAELRQRLRGIFGGGPLRDADPLRGQPQAVQRPRAARATGRRRRPDRRRKS